MKGLGVIAMIAAMSIAVAGCGMSASSPLCAPSGCAGVKGVVEMCGGSPPGHCRLERIALVTLLDSRGRWVAQMHPAAGHLLDGWFSFPAVLPGRYTLETKTAGRVWKRAVTIVADKTTHANIEIPMP